MKEKFHEFLKISEELNKIGIIPFLMGSLGLEQVTGQDWQARDIDIHVPGDPRDGTHLMRYEFMILKRLKRL